LKNQKKIPLLIKKDFNQKTKDISLTFYSNYLDILNKYDIVLSIGLKAQSSIESNINIIRDQYECYCFLSQDTS
jgi:hypothetical protein